METPYVYHIDVAAMYPNIILTNRLQPSAIVDDATCASCDFNQARNNCKRKMQWVWRGDYNPATRGEYDRTRDQLAREMTSVTGDSTGRAFHELNPETRPKRYQIDSSFTVRMLTRRRKLPRRSLVQTRYA